MQRLLALLVLVVGLALAQAPAYPENTVGVGFGIGRGLMLQGSAGLPFSPLGIDTGLDVEVIVPTSFDALEVWALLKANLLPALTVADFSLSAGLGLDVSFNTVGNVFGLHLGPVASLGFPVGPSRAIWGWASKEGLTWPMAWGAALP